MKHLVLFVLLLISSAGITQDYMYLEEIKLKKKDHFSQNESALIKATDYLIETPVNESNMDRMACSRFIIRYAEGTPNTTVVLDGSVLKVYDENLDLLTIFIGLWLKSSINSPDKSDLFHEAYIYDQIYQYAKAGNGIKKTKTMKSLIKSGDKGDLSNWIIKLKK